MMLQTNNILDIFGIGNKTIIIIFLLVIRFVINSVLSVWVYRDKKEREKSGLNYEIIVLDTT